MFENQIVYHKAYKYGIVVAINENGSAVIYFPSVKEKKTIYKDELNLNLTNLPIPLKIPDLANLGMFDFMFDKQSINQGYQVYSSKQLKIIQSNPNSCLALYNTGHNNYIQIKINEKNVVSITLDEIPFLPDKYLYALLLILKNTYLLSPEIKKDNVYEANKMIYSSNQNENKDSKDVNLNYIKNSYMFSILDELNKATTYSDKYHIISQKLNELGDNKEEYKFFFENKKLFTDVFKTPLVKFLSDCLECKKTYRDVNKIKYSYFKFDLTYGFKYLKTYEIKRALLCAFLNNVESIHFETIAQKILADHRKIDANESGILANVLNKLKISTVIKLYESYNIDLTYLKEDKDYLDKTYDENPEFVSSKLDFSPIFDQESFHKDLLDKDISKKALLKDFIRAKEENLKKEHPQLILFNLIRITSELKNNNAVSNKVIAALPNNQFIKLLFTNAPYEQIISHKFASYKNRFDSEAYDSYGNTSYKYNDQDYLYDEDIDDNIEDDLPEDSLPF